MERKWALLNCVPCWLCTTIFAIMYYQSFHPSLTPTIIVTGLFDLFIYYILRTM